MIPVLHPFCVRFKVAFSSNLSFPCRAFSPNSLPLSAAAHPRPIMFWKMSYADTSPIDAVLDRSEFTLEDLLDEDHIIQESKGENEKLLAYLTKEDVLAKLIQCVFAVPASFSTPRMS